MSSAPAAETRMTLAKPANASQWFGDDDYPHEALIENRKGVVTYRVVVTPLGTPQSCGVQSSGFADFDQRTCAILLARSRFVPASDDSGHPIYSVYRGRFVWNIPGSGYEPPSLNPDIEVTVNKLPHGLRKGADVDVLVLFDQKGRISKCDATPSKTPAVLNTLACSQAATLPPQSPILDEHGQPVRWLEKITVRFSVAPPFH